MSRGPPNMRNTLFTWSDMKRIGRSVFDDIPRTEKEIKAWTGTVFLLATSIYHVLRGIQLRIEFDPDLFRGVYAMLRGSVEEMMKGVGLFPQYERDELINFLIEGFILGYGAGYVKVIEDKEIE